MTGHRFPLHHLPDDLYSKVLEIMDHYDIILYSFVSKKAYSMAKTLRLPISSVKILMGANPEIILQIGVTSISFRLIMRTDRIPMASLDYLPVRVRVVKGGVQREIAQLIISNQGMTIGEWIKHLCSISDKDTLYEARFYTGIIKCDIQSHPNTFPKLRIIYISCPRGATHEDDILTAHNVLRAFLPDAQNVTLHDVPLPKDLSFQHIGMANLKVLKIDPPSILVFDDLSTWNVEKCTIHLNQMPLRELNRFFKLWMKGSNPRLKKLRVSVWDTEIIPDCNVLLKGLKAKAEYVYEESKKYTIKNCRRIRAEIKIDTSDDSADFVLTVLN
ncbi:unnamed protein product [Caenorhabditis nigoni]